MKSIFLSLFLLLTFPFINTTNAMFRIDYDITIGSSKLTGFEAVEIEKSQELLSNKCSITLPGQVRGEALNLEEKVKKGDRITVRLGYDEKLVTEFTGYVYAIYPNSPLVIECEDSVYLTRKPVANKILKNVSVTQILGYVIDQINSLSSEKFVLKSDISGFQFDRFAIHEATGYEVLDKLRQETGLLIYASGNELHCHLAFTQKTGDVIYDFTRNIEATSTLKYVSASDEKIRVKVVGRTDKGAKIEVEAGQEGGDLKTYQRPTISDKATLEKIAKEELKRFTYDGYRGDIEGWLVPFCEVGYSAKIRDKDYPEREGKYYVTSVKIKVSKAGGVRTVGLGIILS